jgi:hypothetical protein
VKALGILPNFLKVQIHVPFRNNKKCKDFVLPQVCVIKNKFKE